jgi:hypothetical protein
MTLPIEPEPIHREIPKRSEMGSYTMHSLSPIRERVGKVWKDIMSLIPGAILGLTRIVKPEEEIGITEKAVEELPRNLNIPIGFYQDTRPPLVIEPGIFFAIGKSAREHRINPQQQPDLPETLDQDSDSSDPETL